ncbi:MAG TPA: RimK family alpha-L-glutamate ligase [Phycisphaerae bacterium]|jgi:glutathione synthase/RimK-type ligase-like ATP-grasp enzyme
MARIAVYTERYTIRRANELTALTNFRIAANKLGHQLDFIFRPEVQSIPQYDAVFIRALTDPLNMSFVAARLAELHGIRSIDDANSILICCDKVSMYQHLQRAGVPMPETRFLDAHEVTIENAHELFEAMGTPLVLKAPNSSFSAYVDRVSDAESFVKVGKRFLRRADRVVVQQYIPSTFDWRVTTLTGEVLFVCKYVMPAKHWKIQSMEEGRTVYATVVSVTPAAVEPRLIEVAQSAARAVGDGLYGIDVKQVGDEYFVIEVNDNPNIDAGEEDRSNPEVYACIINHLVGAPWESLWSKRRENPSLAV